MMFSIVAYAIFFATFLYLIVFVGDFSFAGLTVNKGPEAAPTTVVIFDVAVVALFGLQHSVMARQGFKRWWTRIIPWSIERSMYVLSASIMLMILFLGWRPIAGDIWNVSNPAVSGIFWILFWLGWGMVLLSTFLINHFELFGLQHAWLHFRGLKSEPPQFRQPFFYKWVRHPLYLGFFLAFWATPHMTVGHLLLAGGMSVFMLIAIRYEEHDLITLFGSDYEDYRERVGMLLPRFRRRSA